MTIIRTGRVLFYSGQRPAPSHLNLPGQFPALRSTVVRELDDGRVEYYTDDWKNLPEELLERVRWDEKVTP